MAGFILKPLNLDQLLDTLQRICSAIQEHRQNLAYQDHLEQLVEEKSHELVRQMLTDDLTGLPNRLRLHHRLSECGAGSVLMVNLENLNRINTAYGLEIGDLVLNTVADYLRERTPPEAELFRLSCGEFVILQSGAGIDRLRPCAERLSGDLSRFRVDLGGGASLATALTIAGVEGGCETLLSQARACLLETRVRGRNRLLFCGGDSALVEHQRDTLHWMGQVYDALEEERLVVLFQPIHDNRDGHTHKYECLVRIAQGEALISPIHFIGPARLAGLIPALTRTVIDRAVDRILASGHSFSVNITEEDLLDGFLPEHMEKLLRTRPFDPTLLIFEVVETLTAAGESELLEQLRHLKSLGFQLAIDDFGAEHSSFSRIIDLQADYLKIDGQIIRDIHLDRTKYLITQGIVQLARGIDIEVVAEYVHNEEVQQTLKRLGVDYSQGHFIGPPHPET